MKNKDKAKQDRNAVWLDNWSYSFVLTKASAVDNKTAISRWLHL